MTGSGGVKEVEEGWKKVGRRGLSEELETRRSELSSAGKLVDIGVSLAPEGRGELSRGAQSGGWREASFFAFCG